MTDYNVGAVLVVSEAGKLVGIFTERDVLMRVVSLGERFEDLPVSMFMTPDPETLGRENKLAYALHKMDGGDYRHLPIVGEDGRPNGVISVRDILRYVANLCQDK